MLQTLPAGNPSRDVFLLQLTPGLRELCRSFWFLCGAREQLLFLALWFFLLELSEQCAFCVLANNEGAF